MIESITQKSVLMIKNDINTRGNRFFRKEKYGVSMSLSAYLNPEANRNIGTAGVTKFLKVSKKISVSA